MDSQVFIINANNLRSTRSHFNSVGVSELLDFSNVLPALTAAALATTAAQATEKKEGDE